MRTNLIKLLPLSAGIKKALGAPLTYALPTVTWLTIVSTPVLAVHGAYYNSPVTQTQSLTASTLIANDVSSTSNNCVEVAPDDMFTIVSTETEPVSGGNYDDLCDITFTGNTEFQPGTTTANTPANTTSPSPSVANNVASVPSEWSQPTPSNIDTEDQPDVNDSGGPTNTNSGTYTEVNGTYRGAGQTVTTDLDIQAGSSLSNVTFDSDIKNEGWLSNFTLTPDNTLTGGSLTGSVTNQGTLENVEFWGLSLEGGTLAGTTVNYSKFGVIADVQLAPVAVLIGGKVAGMILLSDTSTLEDVQFQEDTFVVGGQLAGDISGEANDPALLIDVTIQPGTYLENVILFPPLQLSEEVILGPGVVLPEDLNLGDFEPDILGELTAEGVPELPPEAFADLNAEQLEALPEEAVAALDKEQVATIPPNAFTGLSATQVEALAPEAVSALSGSQLSQIPPTALSDVTASQMGALQRDTLTQLTTTQFTALPSTALGGLTAQNLGGLSIPVIRKMNPTQVAALTSTEVKNQTGPDLGRLLVNLDAQQIQPTQVVNWLPPDWKLDTTTGALTAPPGTVLTVRELPPPVNSPPQLVLPTIPDLKSSFGVGGVGGASFEEGLQQSLNQGESTPHYQLSQTAQGPVKIEGTDDLKGLNYSFLPITTGIIQADAGVPAGVERLEGGFYQMTTPEGQQIKFLPSPVNPQELADMNECGNIQMGPNGEVFMELPRLQQRRAEEAREVVMFDPLVEPPPEEYCEDIDGETVCDFTEAPPEVQPGFHILSSPGTRAQTFLEVGKIVYNDGTSQKVYPTVLQPETYKALGAEFEGVQKMVFNANGTFEVTHTSGHYLVSHQFEVIHQPLPAGNSVEPSIAVKDASVIYSIPLVKTNPCGNTTRQGRGIRESLTATETAGEAREILTFDSLIEPLPEEVCEEVAGEIICDTAVENQPLNGLPNIE